MFMSLNLININYLANIWNKMSVINGLCLCSKLFRTWRTQYVIFGSDPNGERSSLQRRRLLIARHLTPDRNCC